MDLSIFVKYIKETNEKMTKKCFDVDWEYMKDIAKKYKKSNEEEIKDETFKIYKQLKDLYRV